MTSKSIVNGIQIWVDDGEPCCRPGSIEEALPRVREFAELADKWIEAVTAQQTARRAQQFTKEQERQIKNLMRIMKCDREEAIRFRRQDLSDL